MSVGSISAVFSSPVFDPPEKGGERGLISRTAAGYRAYCVRRCPTLTALDILVVLFKLSVY